MNFDKYKDEIKCLVEGHENMGIFGFCFNIQCKKKICFKCVMTIHNQHVQDCIHFDFFQEIMENELLLFEQICSLQQDQGNELGSLVNFIQQKIRSIRNTIAELQRQLFLNSQQSDDMSFCHNSFSYLKQFLFGCTQIKDRLKMIRLIEQIYQEQDQSIRIKELVSKGDSLRELFCYQEAIQCYEKALEYNPQNFTIFLYKGYCLHMLDEIDSALECFNFVLSVEPQNTQVQQYIDDVQESQQQGSPFSHLTFNTLNKQFQIIRQNILISIFESPEQVIEVCKQYQQSYRKNYLVLAFLSEELLMVGKYEFSLELAEEALKIYPKFNQALNIKVKCLTLLNQCEEANKILIQYETKFSQKDLELLKSFIYLIFLGNLLIKQENFVEAGQHYQKLLDKNQSPYMKYIHLIQQGNQLLHQGKFLLKTKKIPEALVLLRQAEEKQPDNILLQEYIGLCLCELLEYDQAILCFEKVIDLDFGYPFSWKHKATALLFQGRFSEALEVCETYLARYPQNQVILKEKEEVLSYQRDQMIGVDQQEDINSNDIEGLLAHGEVLLGKMLFNEAIKLYNKVLAIQPNKLKALNSKAYCLIKMKIYAEALEIIDNFILPFYPNDQSSLQERGIFFVELGVALYHLNKYEEALSVFTKVKNQNPNYYLISFHRGFNFDLYKLIAYLNLGNTSKHRKFIVNFIRIPLLHIRNPYMDIIIVFNYDYCKINPYLIIIFQIIIFYLQGPIKAIQGMKGITATEGYNNMYYMWIILLIILLRNMHLVQFAISALEMHLCLFETDRDIPDPSIIYFLQGINKLNRGDLLFSLNQYQKALEVLDKFLSKRTLWIALVAKGNCLSRLGRQQQAQQNYNQAVQILGQVWTEKQYEKALLEEMENLEEPLDCWPVDCKPVYRKKIIGSSHLS